MNLRGETMSKIARIILLVCLFAIVAADAVAIQWPTKPFDQPRPIGNSYGEYQFYGGSPYFHPGLDILAPAGTSIYSVKAGYVKAVLTISADLHWRVVVGDSAGADECEGWLYAHLDQATIAVNEGDWVEEGQYLGDLVFWPVADFHHLHFVKIRNSGVVWNSDWEFIGNPLDEMEMIGDTTAPVFEKAYGHQLLGFNQNQSGSYFPERSPLSGDVDIICKAFDYVNSDRWQVAPHKIEYRIEGAVETDWITVVTFTGELDFDSNVDVIYQDDNIVNSRGNYDHRDFFFSLTNSNGNEIIEADDLSYSWNTADYPNGNYTIHVRATDRAGNATEESMDVTVLNYYTLAGKVVNSEGRLNLEGAIVTVLPSGLSDTVNSSGKFSIAQVGGGLQEIEIVYPGYAVADTVLVMNRHHKINIALTPIILAEVESSAISESPASESSAPITTNQNDSLIQIVDRINTQFKSTITPATNSTITAD